MESHDRVRFESTRHIKNEDEREDTKGRIGLIIDGQCLNKVRYAGERMLMAVSVR